MNEGENNFRLNHMEKDILETKQEIKEIAVKQTLQNDKLIQLASDSKLNLRTNEVIKNAALAFLAVNVLGLVLAFMKAVYELI